VVTITVTPILTAGIASADQVICYNSAPAAINATTPTGGDGTYTYQWQVSSDNVTFSNIPGAIALSYSPAALTQTTYYRQGRQPEADAGQLIPMRLQLPSILILLPA